MDAIVFGKPSWIGHDLQIDLTRDVLGVSSTGYVIRITCSDQEYALKRTRAMDKEPPDLARLKHPHVVHLQHYWTEERADEELWPHFDAGVNEESGPSEERYMFLVMELMDGDIGQLMTEAKRAGVSPFSLPVARDIMLQIARGMHYLHEMGTSHPHLKCANVLYRIVNETDRAFVVGDVVVKLGGFGCSRPADLDSKKLDLWCFISTCVEILTGKESPDLIHDESSIPEISPEILKDCIASCLNMRLPFSEIVTKLADLGDVMLTGKDECTSTSESIHPKIVHTKAEDSSVEARPVSGGLNEIFTVHQLHPQLGDVSTSVRATLIFFHGFHKVPEEWRRTWMTRDSKLVWPQTWLPEDLGAGNIRVLSVSFDANLSGNYDRFETGENLIWSLVLSPRLKLGEIEGKIFLVGHSFGGVIIKSLVTEARRFVREEIRNTINLERATKCQRFLSSLATIVFYSVPHAFMGREFENYISECKNIFGSPRSSFLQSLWEDPQLIPDMNELSEEFERVVSDQQMKVLAFLEGDPMSKNRVLFTKKSCESRNWEWHKIDKDNHFEVCRPDSKNHIGYKEMKDHLQRHMEVPEAGKMVLQPRELTDTGELPSKGKEQMEILELERDSKSQKSQQVPGMATSCGHQDVSTTFGGDHDIIVEKVIEKLLQSSKFHSQDDIKCVGIWGLSGSGKTLAAQRVFNNNKIRYHFKGGCYWLIVGNSKISVPHLLRKLHQEMVIPFPVESGDDYIKNDIRRYLKDRVPGRVLLVLDDVWKNDVLDPLDVIPKGVQCTVLITTRNEGVLNRKHATKLKMPMLSSKDSWKLFCHHARLNDANMSMDFEEVGRQIIAVCGGHPLALSFIGKYLAGNIDPSYWKRALDKLKDANAVSSDQDIELLFSKLEFCVDELEKVHPRLKDCFFYFAAFPKDYEVELKRDLFPLWFGDQIVGTDSRYDPMKEAENLLELLVQRSLIEVRFQKRRNVRPSVIAYHCFERFKVYVVHNVLRGLIHHMLQKVSIAKRDCFYVAGLDLNNLPEEYYRNSNISQVTHLSLMSSMVEKLDSKLLNAPKLQLMILRDNPFKVIPDGFPSDHLRVLDLSYTHITSLPESLNLKHLVVLNLRGSLVKELPFKLFKTLTNLEVLIVAECHDLVCLPRTISSLNKLKYLDATQSFLSDLWIEGFFQKLVKASAFLTDLVKASASLTDLVKLVSLKELLIRSTSLKTLPDGIFRSLKHLRVLNLVFENLVAIPEPTENDLQHLQVLDLGGCSSLISLPGSFGIVPKNLHTLNLDICLRLQSLPEGLADLPKLEYLHLNQCSRRLCLPVSFSEPGAFPVLKELLMAWPSYEVCFPDLQPGAMPQLEYLDLTGWPELVDFPKPIANLTKLRFLHLDDCRDLRSLEHDGVGVRSLANLEELHVAGCYEISALPDGLEELPKLREINIWGTTIMVSQKVSHLVTRKPFWRSSNPTAEFAHRMWELLR